METVSAILEQLGKAGNIVALFASTLGVFVFIENMSSSQARADFTNYLKSTDFAGSVVRLPQDTRALFERVFGARHFSLRCVITSVLFSAVTTTGMFAIFFLIDPKAFLSLADLVWEYDPQLLVAVGAWIIWSLVPDYFNLLKTRAILGLATARQINRASILIAIVFADFVVGYAIFSLTFGPILLPFLRDNPLWLEMLFFWPPPFFITFLFPPIITFSSVTAPLFWAGMVPSIWLWLYVAATLIVRLAIRSAPLLRFLTYLLDIDQHPIRSVGIVAATLVSGGYAILLAVSKAAQFVSHRFEIA
jgi:hypothetical protein